MSPRKDRARFRKEDAEELKQNEERLAWDRYFVARAGRIIIPSDEAFSDLTTREFKSALTKAAAHADMMLAHRRERFGAS